MRKKTVMTKDIIKSNYEVRMRSQQGSHFFCYWYKYGEVWYTFPPYNPEERERRWVHKYTKDKDAPEDRETKTGLVINSAIMNALRFACVVPVTSKMGVGINSKWSINFKVYPGSVCHDVPICFPQPKQSQDRSRTGLRKFKGKLTTEVLRRIESKFSFDFNPETVDLLRKAYNYYPYQVPKNPKVPVQGEVIQFDAGKDIGYIPAVVPVPQIETFEPAFRFSISLLMGSSASDSPPRNNLSDFLYE